MEDPLFLRYFVQVLKSQLNLLCGKLYLWVRGDKEDTTQFTGKIVRQLNLSRGHDPGCLVWLYLGKYDSL